MTRVAFRLPVLASLVLAGSALMAQAPGPPGQAPPVPPAQADQQGQKPTFRVTVDLVTNDVIARDARGQFVADLMLDDFEIFEDGVPQTIASMVLVHGARISCASSKLTSARSRRRSSSRSVSVGFLDALFGLVGWLGHALGHGGHVRL